jgi:hypothetical protein
VNPERAAILLAEADVAANLDAIELPFDSGAAYLASLEGRRGMMKTRVKIRELPGVEPLTEGRRSSWRGLVAAAAAAAIVLIVIGAVLVFGDQTSDTAPVSEGVPTPIETSTTATVEAPTTTVAPATTAPAATSAPSTVAPVDPTGIGAALSAAHSSHDAEALLGLFTDDATLTFNSGATVLTVEDIRSGGHLPGTAVNFQYDRSWAIAMNERFDYTSCVANGDRVVCELVQTTDFLAPLVPPERHTVAMQVRDGKIVGFVLAGIFDETDEVRDAYHAWTYANYPEEAGQMWVAEWSSDTINTAESAALHRRLTEEYIHTLG